MVATQQQPVASDPARLGVLNGHNVMQCSSRLWPAFVMLFPRDCNRRSLVDSDRCIRGTSSARELLFSLHTCFSDDHVGIAIPRNGASWSGLKNVCNCVIIFHIDTVLRGYAFITLPVPDAVRGY